jgi:hypothetical protein
MSDIPHARRLIIEVLDLTGVDQAAKMKLREALALMWRRPPSDDVEPEIPAGKEQYRLPASGM